MLAWLIRLFAPQARRPKSAPPRAASSSDRVPLSRPDREPALALPTTNAARASGLPNLDRPSRPDTALGRRELELIERIDARITAGDFELPHLASTSVAVIDFASRPSVEVKDLVKLIENDPVLTSELLKLANSAYYTGRMPVETLQQAVVRIGIRALRSMIFSISVRGAVLRDKSLSAYAEEVWRQAFSVASIARAIGPLARIEAEHAFLLGLLHDIGKVPLLSMLRQEVRKESEIGPALVGRIFLEHHEKAGAALAVAWKLPAEIAAVAGCHHRFAENEGYARSAALASLAHKLDLYLSLGSEVEYRNLVHTPEIEFLGLAGDPAHALIAAGAEAFAPRGETAGV